MEQALRELARAQNESLDKEMGILQGLLGSAVKMAVTSMTLRREPLDLDAKRQTTYNDSSLFSHNTATLIV